MIHSPKALRAGRVFEPGLRLAMLATGTAGFDQIFPDVVAPEGLAQSSRLIQGSGS